MEYADVETNVKADGSVIVVCDEHDYVDGICSVCEMEEPQQDPNKDDEEQGNTGNEDSDKEDSGKEDSKEDEKVDKRVNQSDNILLCKALLIIGAFYAVLQLFGITCPIKFLSGISCCGCGMTRALISAVRLDFAAAFYYHPLFFLVPLGVILFLFRSRIRPLYFKIVIWLFIFAFLAVYGYRLLCTNSDIVVFNPTDSIVIKLLNSFID